MTQLNMLAVNQTKSEVRAGTKQTRATDSKAASADFGRCIKKLVQNSRDVKRPVKTPNSSNRPNLSAVESGYGEKQATEIPQSTPGMKVESGTAANHKQQSKPSQDSKLELDSASEGIEVIDDDSSAIQEQNTDKIIDGLTIAPSMPGSISALDCTGNTPEEKPLLDAETMQQSQTVAIGTIKQAVPANFGIQDTGQNISASDPDLQLTAEQETAKFMNMEDPVSKSGLQSTAEQQQPDNLAGMEKPAAGDLQLSLKQAGNEAVSLANGLSGLESVGNNDGTGTGQIGRTEVPQLPTGNSPVEQPLLIADNSEVQQQNKVLESDQEQIAENGQSPDIKVSAIKVSGPEAETAKLAITLNNRGLTGERTEKSRQEAIPQGTSLNETSPEIEVANSETANDNDGRTKLRAAAVPEGETPSPVDGEITAESGNAGNDSYSHIPRRNSEALGASQDLPERSVKAESLVLQPEALKIFLGKSLSRDNSATPVQAVKAEAKAQPGLTPQEDTVAVTKQLNPSPDKGFINTEDQPGVKQQNSGNSAATQEGSSSTDVKKLIEFESKRLSNEKTEFRAMNPDSTLNNQSTDNSDSAQLISKTGFESLRNQSNSLSNASASLNNDFDTGNVLEQIVKNAELILKQNTSEMKIQLQPEFLGKVTIKIMLEDGAITAKFITDSHQVKHLLDSNLNTLRQSLETQGMKVEKTEVNVQLSNGGMFDGSQGERQDLWQQHKFMPSYRQAEDLSEGYQLVSENDELTLSPALENEDYGITSDGSMNFVV